MVVYRAKNQIINDWWCIWAFGGASCLALMKTMLGKQGNSFSKSMKQEKKRETRFHRDRLDRASHDLLNRANWRTRHGGLLHQASNVVDWPVVLERWFCYMSCLILPFVFICKFSLASASLSHGYEQSSSVSPQA